MMSRLAVALISSLALGACAPSRSGESVGAQAKSPHIFSQSNIRSFGTNGSKKIALTFDDGPKEGTTERILDTLKSEGIQATFFILGKSVSKREGILRRMEREGHIIGNHSRTHPRLTNDEYVKDKEKVVEEILTTHDLIEPFQDPLKRLYFRAPFGLWTASHADHLNRHEVLSNYIGPIHWTAGGQLKFEGDEIQKAADWDCWSRTPAVSVETCAKGYIKEITEKQGGVVLMHDIHESTARMLPIVIRELKSQGYEFVTLDELPELHEWD